MSSAARFTRDERRLRAVARVKVPIPAELKAQDPLLRGARTMGTRVGWVGLVLVAALFLHVFVLFSLGLAASAMRADIPDRPEDSRIEMVVVEPPPPPPPPPVEPEAETETEAEPEPKPKPKPPPKKADPPPPDPVDLPKNEPPPPPSDKPPPRRIVGLSMESTVGGGDGPSFAVGNTRMGETEKTAEDPNEAKELPKTTKPPPPAKTNRRAARIPTGNAKVIPPAPKTKVVPAYPDIYRAQNLGATVVVQVTVGINGRTKNQRIISKSRYEKFNEAALLASKQQTFEPATKGGVAIELTISIPYIFRLTD